MEDESDLPWAKFLKCRAVLERRPEASYWGRCELMPGHFGIDHALERGMEIIRWSTDYRVESAVRE
jgi:hypothetical protein